MEPKSPSAPETAMPRAPAPRAPAPRPHENGNGHGIATNGSAKTPHREALAESPTNGTSAVVSRTPAGGWRGSDATHWLNAYEAIQCRTAEAHAVYQQTMAQCHLAFLRAAEQSAMALASLAMSSPSAPMPALSASRGMALPPAHDPHDSFAMPMQAIQWSAPAHAPAPVVARAPAPRPPPTPVAVSDAGLVTPPAVQVRAPSPAAAPPAPVAATPPKASAPMGMPADGDVKTFLFSVIAEKTGYPVEILNLDQQLEADLGIDSIKRVEILSAFEGQIPDIKDINLEEVASLSTLRDVVAFMEKFSDKLGLAKKKE